MTREKTKAITKIIIEAAKKARKELSVTPEAAYIKPIKWPVECTVGPGLEGAIACESKVGYVNGSAGWLVYRGYDIFDLCAYSNFEEVSYLLIYGTLPTKSQFKKFKKTSFESFKSSEVIRQLMGFPIEKMNTMSALSLGTGLIRQNHSYIDLFKYRPDLDSIIGADEDSIPMETKPMGEAKAIYEFKIEKLKQKKDNNIDADLYSASSYQACYTLLSGVSAITGAIARIHQGKLPIEPDPNLSFAANLLYMITGRIPNAIEERVMDVALILHADHGMNASTFATMVVGSTLSDFYFAVGAGIGALNGPLHGGANERVLHILNEIGDVKNVKGWYKKAREKKQKIMGFGHRVYKAYDPRARVLGPLAKYLVEKSTDKKTKELFAIATALENEVVTHLGKEKKIFPNVDFYSGLVYASLGIPAEIFTPIFAVSRVAGWSARALEYLKNNRIFRPRAMYTGQFELKYTSIEKRGKQSQV